MRNYKNEQSGRSMVEMLGVLAIIGVLSVGGIAGYSKAMAKFKIAKTLDQISMLVTNVRTFYGNQPNFKGLENKTVIKYDLASADMVSGSALLYNPFGGAITVKADSSDNGKFTITYEKLDTMSCITITTADWGGTASSGLTKITINALPYTWAGSTDTTKLPISFAGATASGACTLAENKIIWEYR